MMNYEEALAFHEETKQYGSILGLDTIRNLMYELKDIWKDLQIVHIAGTNGKGSVCCFLSAVLQEAGYKVGQFNSPAVFDLREVYQINGEMIEKAEYAKCMSKVEKACKRLVEKGLPHPTVFEVETALGFLWFYQKQCDIVLLETGMGGSTDATNLIEAPLCAVLTSVSMDHMEFLGNTLEEIAEVKAGIIKEKSTVISAKQSKAVEVVFRRMAEKKQASYHQAAEINSYKIEEEKLCYTHPSLGKIQLCMCGGYQAENSSLAIEVLLALRDKGYAISDEQIKNGLYKAKWKGRFECICKSPFFVIDGAHNTDAAYKLRESLLKNYPNTRKIGIMGVMADKPYREMLEILLPLFDKVYTIKPDNPRALSAKELAEEINRQKTLGIAAETIEKAVYIACQECLDAKEDTIIIAFGSLYYLGRVRQIVRDLKIDNLEEI
ncbi:MAG: bifunctional folylpolyglutamate synthase/dihydrofolate synthase [Lachnospiraceae bacterium]|nr:bifunctional folylpolyglutamate synthase/dihydrofolate synthase [Lachnospiraceae bacterium]